ncbi:hypothetical protein SDC9_21900 [bioreactor metagenome]|uniref:Uncharacterized protein n=1 Tax=bioreactor metagenome TaxID=1076179 RepID=A0A644UAN3_9ZZZZ
MNIIKMTQSFKITSTNVNTKTYVCTVPDVVLLN